MNQEELRQDILDAYDALHVSMKTAENATRDILKDEKRLAEAKKALADYEKDLLTVEEGVEPETI